jgi:hypothetical protein
MRESILFKRSPIILRPNKEYTYRESLFCIISIHVATVLSIKEHLKPQVILVDCTPLLYPVYLADVNKECYRGPLATVLDGYAPVPTQMGTEPR